MLRLILERAGYEVDEAADGEEAVKIYNDTEPDLLITDIIMPEKEGVGAIMDIRKDHPDAKIIAISGGGRFAAENYLVLARSLGAQRIFSKPFERDEILGAVKELIGAGSE